MSNKFAIAETDTFVKKKKQLPFSKYYKKIYDYVYPQLQINPYYGINIKKLKGEYEGIYRYRIGDYRLFYLIKEKEIVIIMVDIQQRKDSYKQKK